MTRRGAVRAALLLLLVTVLALAAVAARDGAARLWDALTAGGADDGDEDEDDDGDDDGDDDAFAPPPVVGGMPAVRLDAARAALAGVTATRLEPARRAPAAAAPAEVVDIQPLAALRDRYRERFFAARAAEVQLEAARRDHERLAALHRGNADVSEKAALRAEADRDAARAERDRVRAELAALRARARREWGPALAGRAFSADGAGFAGLASGADSLLRAAAPPGAVAPGGARGAWFEHGGARIAAEWLAPAPRAAGGGAGHFFLARGAAAPAGLRLTLRIPLADEAAEGLALPPEAAVRAMGRDWVYVRAGADLFVRREVTLAGPLPDGRYWLAGREPAGEVVTAGAAILYAEEFRSQIRNEDDDD